MNLYWSLLLSFLKIGACSIGGGYATIALIKQEIVIRQHWLTSQEFLDMITLSQMTPGPLAINTSTFAGLRTAGFFGAFLATIGCIATGVCCSLFLYTFLRKHKSSQRIAVLLEGLKAISTGLIATSAMTILSLAFLTEDHNGTSLRIQSLLIFFITLYLARKKHLSLMKLMGIAGLLGLLLPCFSK